MDAVQAGGDLGRSRPVGSGRPQGRPPALMKAMSNTKSKKVTPGAISGFTKYSAVLAGWWQAFESSGQQLGTYPLEKAWGACRQFPVQCTASLFSFCPIGAVFVTCACVRPPRGIGARWPSLGGGMQFAIKENLANLVRPKSVKRHICWHGFMRTFLFTGRLPKCNCLL